MNVFYAPPSQIGHGMAELTGQEAIHASKVLRVREGDDLTVVDGQGGRYTGQVRRITKKMVQMTVKNHQHVPAARPKRTIGMGIIKKRNRLEFAVEKAVELGASHILLFRSDHTIKDNVRMDRLESLVLSAMKQSLRVWLPEVTLYPSFEEVLDICTAHPCLMAHERVSPGKGNPQLDWRNEKQLNLLVGPEGGFSSEEVEEATRRGAQLYSLGTQRLRAETAVTAFLSQFLI